jgi:hypothetical protein
VNCGHNSDPIEIKEPGKENGRCMKKNLAKLKHVKDRPRRRMNPNSLRNLKRFGGRKQSEEKNRKKTQN